MHKDGRPLNRINELEMIKGYVFANVWFDDNVYKIDPNTGTVVDTYNFAELYPKPLQKKELTSKEAVLNGIAWDPVEDVLYLTGLVFGSKKKNTVGVTLLFYDIYIYLRHRVVVVVYRLLPMLLLLLLPLWYFPNSTSSLAYLMFLRRD